MRGRGDDDGGDGSVRVRLQEREELLISTEWVRAACGL